MTQPVWRKVVSELEVPDPGKQWKVALDALTAGKLMKVEVVVDPKRNPPENGMWIPQGFAAACSADGDFAGTARGPAFSGTLPVPSAPPGALIARIGGSTADQTADTSATLPRVVFSIGRQCVFSVPSTPVGSLYLGVNDDPTRMSTVNGRLRVNIYEST